MRESREIPSWFWKPWDLLALLLGSGVLQKSGERHWCLTVCPGKPRGSIALTHWGRAQANVLGEWWATGTSSPPGFFPHQSRSAAFFSRQAGEPREFLHSGARGRPSWGKRHETPGGAKQVLRCQTQGRPLPRDIYHPCVHLMFKSQGCSDGAKS